VTVFTKEDFVKWGKRGGKKRSRNQTAQQRKESAQNAVRARWDKAKKKATA